MAQNNEIKQIIETVREQYAPDKRVEVFDISVSKRADTLVLKGKTTSLNGHAILMEKMSVFQHVKDSIRLLPDRKLGDQTWGIVYNSTGTIHLSPSYSSETVSQTLLGTPVKVLEKQGGWLRVQMPDRYIGWINGAVQSVTEDELRVYNRSQKIIVTAFTTRSFEQSDEKSLPVSDLVMGNLLELTGDKGGFFQVKYPDGRAAFVKKSNAKKTSEWLKNIKLTQKSIVSLAMQFMGVPYVWGGTSSKGLDCSGFTKTVYFNHGIILPRDASQQALTGKLVDDKGDFDKLQPGDLVFFGTKATDENPKERVIHVGIYIGGKRFIHASDYVRINSFDPNDSLYDAYNTNRYLRTKRILGEVGTDGLETVFENAFYSRSSVFI